VILTFYGHNHFHGCFKQGEQRVTFAPSSYPGLAECLSRVLEDMLGQGVHQVVINPYLQKLRKYSSEERNDDLQRKTPRYLRVIVTPSEHQESRLAEEPQGDVATLRLDAMEDILGSMANVFTASVF
jgi:hypothetical protein